ncbi:MAG: carboxypeptidase-like regulatory domain-containing protein [Bacteroidales bacterium]|jgi:hypothetical protein|nr:carboxypeptidase-like regulatory domain-containing protein [Bacteroidales bacterium]
MLNLNSNKRFRRLIWKTAVCWLGLCFASVALLSGANRDAEGRIVAQPGNTVTGVITDESGEPMAGATVQIKGSTRGVAMLHVSQYDVTF